MGEPSAIQTLNITVGGVSTYGYYALPSTTPKGVVVLGHGYPTTAHSTVPLMAGIAERDDVTVIAMDHHDTVDLEGPTGNTSRSWKVSEEAADSIAATQLFTSTCQGLNPGPFVFKAPDRPPGLTLDGDVLGLIPGYVSPFAGHVNGIVIGAALDRLDALYREGKAPSGLKLTPKT